MKNRLMVAAVILGCTILVFGVSTFSQDSFDFGGLDAGDVFDPGPIFSDPGFGDGGAAVQEQSFAGFVGTDVNGEDFVSDQPVPSENPAQIPEEAAGIPVEATTDLPPVETTTGAADANSGGGNFCSLGPDALGSAQSGGSAEGTEIFRAPEGGDRAQ